MQDPKSSDDKIPLIDFRGATLKAEERPPTGDSIQSKALKDDKNAKASSSDSECLSQY